MEVHPANLLMDGALENANPRAQNQTTKEEDWRPSHKSYPSQYDFPDPYGSHGQIRPGDDSGGCSQRIRPLRSRGSHLNVDIRIVYFNEHSMKFKHMSCVVCQGVLVLMTATRTSRPSSSLMYRTARPPSSYVCISDSRIGWCSPMTRLVHYV